MDYNINQGDDGEKKAVLEMRVLRTMRASMEGLSTLLIGMKSDLLQFEDNCNKLADVSEELQQS
eukprot:m.122138 g.122138  ORF g.122138 m.122138 type:complete len:64 (-) comp9390_c0_seq5:334-525(-)